MKRFSSLRDYIEALREIGELVEVEREVDWNLEMGAISRRIYETGSPAALFTSITDTAPGFRALTAPVGTSRIPGQHLSRLALTLGLDPHADAREIIETLVAARDRAPIPPVRVEAAPCKQHILLGDEVDLTTLPSPYLHAGDGGRYLNTLGIIIVRSPDGRWTNWSVARIQVLDERRATGTVMPFQHLGQIFAEWRKLGQDMPFALALGVEPLALFAGGSPLPRDIDEVNYIGGYFGEPVEVITCETNDLEVPATAEIVIEGRLSISELALEGPYGDFGGYMFPDTPAPEPVYHVDAITHRDNPIFPFSSSGEPADETHTIIGPGMAAEMVVTLRTAGLPVATAWTPFESACGWLVVTVTDDWRDVESDGRILSRRIAETALGMRGHGTPLNTVIVLEDDVNPADLGEVVWALQGRYDTRPENRILVEGVLNWPTTPYIFPAIGNYPQGWMNPRIVYNCLPPVGVTRPERTGFAHNVPAAVRDRVLANWLGDGFPDTTPR
ncbi:UbiD family decarboxylase [Nocardia concava]|uniref:UbiD family decarboxylase n=1 Tax=Nocardia concava TaxID=257281 RepID=UPI0002F0B53B|nr:UbiD family decarboxylase [Nocardia concava]